MKKNLEITGNISPSPGGARGGLVRMFIKSKKEMKTNLSFLALFLIISSNLFPQNITFAQSNLMKGEYVYDFSPDSNIR